MSKQNIDRTNTEKGRLWVISELYYPEMTSTGYYLTKIAEGLTEAGEINVICGQPNYSAKGTTAARKESHNGVSIHRVFGTRLDKNVIPYRIINMLSLSVSVFFKCLLHTRKGDQVLVVTNPPMMPFLTMLATGLHGVRQTLLIHDCYPEILYAAGKLKEKTLLARFLETISRSVLRRACKIIVVGRDMKQRINAKLDREIPITVIPNWAELDVVSPESRNKNELLVELGLVEKFVFLYAGNMGYPNDIATFLKVAEEIRGKEDHIHFVFLGAGVKKEHLVNTVKLKNLKNITVLDSRPRSEQQVFLNACDVGVVSLVEKMFGVSMPSRTYNILAAGKPILALCEPESEIAKVVDEDDVGWHLRPNDPKALKETILEIANIGEDLGRYSINARNAAVARYSHETAIAQYIKAVLGLQDDVDQ